MSAAVRRLPRKRKRKAAAPESMIAQKAARKIPQDGSPLLDILPDELIEHIFTFLPCGIGIAGAIRGVCKRFKNVHCLNICHVPGCTHQEVYLRAFHEGDPAACNMVIPFVKNDHCPRSVQLSLLAAMKTTKAVKVLVDRLEFDPTSRDLLYVVCLSVECSLAFLDLGVEPSMEFALQVVRCSALDCSEKFAPLLSNQALVHLLNTEECFAYIAESGAIGIVELMYDRGLLVLTRERVDQYLTVALQYRKNSLIADLLRILMTRYRVRVRDVLTRESLGKLVLAGWNPLIPLILRDHPDWSWDVIRMALRLQDKRVLLLLLDHIPEGAFPDDDITEYVTTSRMDRQVACLLECDAYVLPPEHTDQVGLYTLLHSYIQRRMYRSAALLCQRYGVPDRAVSLIATTMTNAPVPFKPLLLLLKAPAVIRAMSARHAAVYLRFARQHHCPDIINPLLLQHFVERGHKRNCL